MKNYIQNPNQKVVITFDGNQTLARIYENNKVVARGISTCSPEDEFDLVLGSALAMSRAVESLPPKKVEWVVVNRKPRVGDYVRIVTPCFSFDTKGDILRVNRLLNHDNFSIKPEDHPNYVYISTYYANHEWYYFSRYVEVVEPRGNDSLERYNGEWYRKVTDRKPKPGDYMKIIKSPFPFELPGKIYKISGVTDDGNTLNVRNGDHPEHKEYFNNAYFNDDYLWYHNMALMKIELLEKV